MAQENVLNSDFKIVKMVIDDKNITEENGKYYTIINDEKYVFIPYLNTWVGLK